MLAYVYGLAWFWFPVGLSLDVKYVSSALSSGNDDTQTYVQAAAGSTGELSHLSEEDNTFVVSFEILNFQFSICDT